MTVRARPTLDEIRQWPATVHVVEAAAALGCSKTSAYEAIRTNTFPVRTATVCGRLVVFTSSILEFLTGRVTESAA